MRTLAATLALATLLPREGTTQSPDPRTAVIAIADSALAAITRGDVIALTDLMIPEAVMSPTSTRNGTTTYRVRTREGQRTAAMTGVVERGFAPQALVNGGVAMVWYPTTSTSTVPGRTAAPMCSPS